MDIIDHGDWVPYKPDPWPAHLSNHRNVLFCRRVSDGIDWYVFQRKQLTNANTIKMTLIKIMDHWWVQATYRDASMIFPQNNKLIEITSVMPEDFEQYRDKTFDLTTREFKPRPPPPELPKP